MATASVLSQRSRTLELLVFTSGAVCLGVEIAAARLLAPWFGASTIVWANTIAIVLVALALGYSLGGRIADRSPQPDVLARLVLASAVMIAIVPFISGPFLRLAVDAVNQLSAATFVGSLISVGLLVALPVFILGMVSPFAIRLSVADVEGAGRVSGRLYAISTVGSLTGTFLASLLLIPVVGTRETFLLFAAALAIVSIPLLQRGKITAGLTAVIILALIALPTGTLKSANAGEVLWEQETEYQYARVVKNSAASDRIALELNEGHAVHSVYEPGRWLTGGYWDEMLVLALAATTSPPRSVAILGNAAGTTARALGHFFPETHIDGVELDPVVTKIGKSMFDMQAPNLRTHTGDARPWLWQQTQRYDAILVDAYRQPYIPFYLTTHEFFELAKDRLNPGGVVILNVGHPERSDALEKALSATMGSVFGSDNIWRDPSEPTNTMVVATTATAPGEALAALASQLPSELADVADATVARLEPGLRGGPVWTDDRAPVEWLIDASLANEAR